MQLRDVLAEYAIPPCKYCKMDVIHPLLSVTAKMDVTCKLFLATVKMCVICQVLSVTINGRYLSVVIID